ncbi:retrovirus-related Pol polyprotein from transposon TNT 1-94 [Trichonephila clavipes]|uniref:Retrovirus-related Pol polyprotein from transposon TNT 1-94 n=1 Tax=Trichonephila clavipes TaxID=2585209 RepID=A0A8X6WAK4_TRICX|nr:retrovirus-related Pol polyprotein from transposon TNT 1-94 [Trichonephila clavipes]
MRVTARPWTYSLQAENMREQVNLKPTYVISLFAVDSHVITVRGINTRSQSREAWAVGDRILGLSDNGLETVAGYISRARGITTKCHSLGLDVSPRELVHHTVREFNGKFSKMRTDNGLEFENEQLDTYLANLGIYQEKPIPYNSESNGKVERANRVLLERARSLL